MRPIGRLVHVYDHDYGGRAKCSGEPYRDPTGHDHPSAVIDTSKLLLKPLPYVKATLCAVKFDKNATNVVSAMWHMHCG